MNQKRQIIISGSLATVAVLSGVILASSNIYADDVVDEINITVPVSCSISGTGMNTHNAEINNGQYNSAIGETTIKAFCNDNNGFAIYAIGYTDDTDGNNVLTSSTYDITTGTATSGATSNWAMKLSTVSSPTPTYPITIQNSFNSFQEVPDDYTLVAKRTSSTDIGTGAEGSTIKTTYQAYISPTQPAGTYTGQVKYTLVHPHNAATPRKIINCNPSGDTISSIVCMQDITSSNKSSILSSMTEDAQYQLYDSRDSKRYYIAKLKDDNIWMTQNLDLDLDSTRTYTSADTDLPTNTTWTPANSTVIESSGGGSDTTPGSSDPGDIYWNGLYDWGTYYDSCVDDACDESSMPGYVSNGNPHYYAGNGYNWTAAIAVNDSTDYYVDNLVVDRSICPAGWTMPTIDLFYDMYASYNFAQTSAVFSSPIYFIIDNEYQDFLYGHLWTSNAARGYDWATGYANYIIYNSDNFYSYNEYSTDHYAVRCIVK